MKADIKAQWIADLRANPDAQGTQRLDYLDSDGNRKQCCLGRLSLLAVKAGVIPAPELHGDKYRYLDDNETSSSFKVHETPGESFHQEHALPRKVQEWAGLDRNDIQIVPREEDLCPVTAIGGNDGGMTFATIADLIEKNVPVTG